jgi:hypothetical protein
MNSQCRIKTIDDLSIIYVARPNSKKRLAGKSVLKNLKMCSLQRVGTGTNLHLHIVAMHEGNSKINLRLLAKKKRVVIAPKRTLSSNK